MVKSEVFATKIIELAAKEKLTMAELCYAVDIAKRISDNSTVEREAIKKTDFPSTHIVEACSEKGLFRD